MQSSASGACYLLYSLTQPSGMQECYLVYYLTELAGATFMLFTRTCDSARKTALMLRNLGFDAIPIHGQMPQAKRIGALNKFKAGERSILVATGETVSIFAVLTHTAALVFARGEHVDMVATWVAQLQHIWFESGLVYITVLG